MSTIKLEVLNNMTDKEKSDTWKKVIKQSLMELQDLREVLNPVPFTSPFWEEYRGAYGDVREDVAFLFCPKELVPEMDKLIWLDFEEKSDEQINLDNLCENLFHQLSFYPATYLTMPYLVLLLEKKRREQDYHWQLEIILQAGIILSTNIWNSENSENSGEEPIPDEILKSYQKSKELLCDRSKEFLKQHIEEIKQESDDTLQYLATSLLSIFGNPGAAFQLVLGS